MAELQPRIDEIEMSLVEVKGDNEKHRVTLAKLQQEQEEQKERALALRNGKLESESEKAQLITYLAKASAPVLIPRGPKENGSNGGSRCVRRRTGVGPCSAV